MANRSLSVLAVVLIGVSLPLVTSTSVKSSKRQERLLDEPKQRKPLERPSYRSEQEERSIKYLIAFNTKSVKPSNFTYTEIAETLTHQECEKYGERCSIHSFCALTKYNYKPVCLCEPKKCWTEISEPICGTDGKTYNNPCELYFRSCMYGKNVTVLLQEECPEIPRYYNDMKDFGCGIVGSRDGKAPNRKEQKVSTNGCYQFPHGHVCGSNEVVYENLCALDQARCVNSVKTSVTDPRNCGVVNMQKLEPYIYEHDNKLPKDVAMRFCEASGLNCPMYSNCSYHIVHEAKPWYDFTSTEVKKYFCRCESFCKSTYRYQKPVCGTDSNIYPSLCELRRTACFEKRFIEEDSHMPNCLKPTVFFDAAIAAKRLLDKEMTDHFDKVGNENCLNEYKICSIYAICAQDRSTKYYTCFCKSKCHSDTKLVCGSDAQTYLNQCDLESKACALNANITVAYEGVCRNYNFPIIKPDPYQRSLV